MLTQKIESQDFAVRILKSHLKNSRVSHAYLFTGEPGCGNADLALAFACSLNCLSNNYFQDCECNACHKIAQKNHPDIHTLGEDEDARSIKIEDIRKAIGSASLKPYEGKWKVFIILGAERMTLDASNALLKTLEEAPRQTVFILVAGTRASLLETIHSRTFELRLKPLATLSSLPLGFAQDIKKVTWEDYLDQAGGSRENLNQAIENLMLYFRERLGSASPEALESYVEAINSLLECQDALDSNANQKLVASRLAMKLRQALPIGKQ